MKTILDFDLGFLKDSTALVDERLEQLSREVEESPDPDSYGVYDSMEYISGFGFVACQTYAIGVVSMMKVKKSDALELGPKHRTGRTMIALVNAAANYWKHSSEWSFETPSSQAEQTLTVITSLGIDTTEDYYPLGNMLHRILAPHPARFSSLLPFLTQWRDCLQ